MSSDLGFLLCAQKCAARKGVKRRLWTSPQIPGIWPRSTVSGECGLHHIFAVVAQYMGSATRC